MNEALLAIQIIVSGALVAVIAIQGKGGGLGSAFGAGYAAYSKRRGVEKFVHQSTIALVVFFFLISVANIVL